MDSDLSDFQFNSLPEEAYPMRNKFLDCGRCGLRASGILRIQPRALGGCF